MRFKLVENSFRRHAKWNNDIDYKSTMSSMAPIIKDITLLSVEDAAALPLKVRMFTDDWWLKSPSNHLKYVCSVNYQGIINNGGYYITSRVGVRPVLIIPNLKASTLMRNTFKLYDEVEFKGIRWIIISDTMLLCNDDSFGISIFDSSINYYESSFIRKYLYDKALEYQFFTNIPSNHLKYDYVYDGTNPIKVDDVFVLDSEDRKKIQTLLITKDVTEIEDEAFSHLLNLKYVVFEDNCPSLKSIGYAAFEFCDSLEYIKLPDSVRSIDDYAFQKCFYLYTVVIPPATTKFGIDIFDGCPDVVIHCKSDSLAEYYALESNIQIEYI